MSRIKTLSKQDGEETAVASHDYVEEECAVLGEVVMSHDHRFGFSWKFGALQAMAEEPELKEIIRQVLQVALKDLDTSVANVRNFKKEAVKMAFEAEDKCEK